MILLIDNYDSFTFNIVQYLEQLNAEVKVVKNDAISLNYIESMVNSATVKAIILGPGPGKPEDAGITLKCIDRFAGKLPILGVCLGHQAIAQAFGAKIIRATHVMHGRTSNAFHLNQGCFVGLNNPLLVTRYHSLLVDKHTLPATLNVTACTVASQSYANEHFKHDVLLNRSNVGAFRPLDIYEIMGIRHTSLPIEGVQFHPESILSESGLALFNNFLTQYVLKH